MSHIRTLDIAELNERLAELTQLREDLTTARADRAALVANGNASAEELEEADNVLESAEDGFGEDEQAELARLEALRDDIGSKGDCISDDSGPFVHEADFTDYARELAEDIGAISRNADWPLSFIDWDRAADALKTDYSVVSWQGDDYLYRS